MPMMAGRLFSGEGKSKIMTADVLSLEQAQEIAADPGKLALRLNDLPYPDSWAFNCHRVSIELVKAGVFGYSRVARGWIGIGCQHSWIVLGSDVYDPEAVVVDPTLFSYDPGVTGIFVGRAGEHPHTPHGSGSIWDWGRPVCGNGEIVKLTPRKPLSSGAKVFLRLLGPLDYQGWMVLASAPMEGWPASEIIAAIDDTKGLSSVVPIDILGMLTDRNPGGLFLPGPDTGRGGRGEDSGER